jgi:hypothetical protein
MGALRSTPVRRMVSHASRVIPDELPERYTCSPMSMGSNRRGAPAASSTRRVASMISGPMPSPWATAMGVVVGVAAASGDARVDVLVVTVRPPRAVSDPRSANRDADYTKLPSYIKCEGSVPLGNERLL